MLVGPQPPFLLEQKWTPCSALRCSISGAHLLQMALRCYSLQWLIKYLQTLNEASSPGHQPLGQNYPCLQQLLTHSDAHAFGWALRSISCQMACGMCEMARAARAASTCVDARTTTSGSACTTQMAMSSKKDMWIQTGSAVSLAFGMWIYIYIMNLLWLLPQPPWAVNIMNLLWLLPQPAWAKGQKCSHW